MPVTTSPPAIVEQAPNRPLMDEMVQRALAAHPQAPDVMSQPQDNHSAKWPMLATLLGGAGDVATTQMGLARGGKETNPLLPQNRLGNGIALSGAYLGTALLTKLLNDHGHSDLAKALGYGGGLVGGAAALHNLGPINSLGNK